MPWSRNAIAVCLLPCGCAAPPPAGTAPLHYECRFTTAPIILDGRLDEPAWEAAMWTEPFVDIQGHDKPPPRFATGAKMLWDDEYFYVGAVMQEPHVWATLTEHDQIVYHDNDFEVFVDPDHDGDLYFEVEVNAFNTIFDLFLVRPYSRGGPALHDWDFKGMRTVVSVSGTLNEPGDEDRGWSVEIAMPWHGFRPGVPRTMNLPPESGEVWRVNFSRVQWKHDVLDGRYEKVPGMAEDNWVWSPQGEINMHVPERWGFVRFVR